MKNIIFLICFACCLNVVAQEIVQTPFWQTSFVRDEELQLKPLQDGLVLDCKDYSDYLQSEGDSIKASEIEFARSLPLRKQMKDNYEALFEVIPAGKSKSSNNAVNHNSTIVPFLFFQIEYPIVSIVLSTLKNIGGRFTEQSLTALSKKFNLPETVIEIFRSPDLSRIGLKINGRDVACDILNGKYLLSAQVEYNVSLPDDVFNKMNKFYSQIEDEYYRSINHNENSFVRAARLGYIYGNLYQNENVASKDIKQNIKHLFKNIFYLNSLDINENWVGSENKKTIKIQKTINAGYGTVNIGL